MSALTVYEFIYGLAAALGFAPRAFRHSTILIPLIIPAVAAGVVTLKGARLHAEVGAIIAAALFVIALANLPNRPFREAVGTGNTWAWLEYSDINQIPSQHNMPFKIHEKHLWDALRPPGL